MRHAWKKVPGLLVVEECSRCKTNRRKHSDANGGTWTYHFPSATEQGNNRRYWGRAGLPDCPGPPDPNDVALARAGVRKAVHRAILVERLPCGIPTVEEAIADGTPWQTNAPRAILVCHWKGMLAGFAESEKRAGEAQR